MRERIDRRTPTKAESLELIRKQLDRQAQDRLKEMPPFVGSSERAVFAAVVAFLGEGIPCAACGVKIPSRDLADRDHTISLRSVPEAMRAGLDTVWNWRLLCLPCHDDKTNKRGAGAASHSDSTLHAKLRRLEKRARGETKQKGKAWPKKPLSTASKLSPPRSRPWPEGRKLQSRPFQRPSTRNPS